MIEVKVIGQMDNTMDNTFESANRVYDVEGLCPTVNTCGGGGLQPKVIVASRGRNPQNPSDRTAGNHVEQRLEPNSEGICNTLTSVQKDNLVLENLLDVYNNKMRDDKCSGTLTTNGNTSFCKCGTFGVIEKSPYRIRKLTPLECWRLMDFTDEDFYKAKFVIKIEEKQDFIEQTEAKVNKILNSSLPESKKVHHIKNLSVKIKERTSNSQLYKQAGNSIVKAVLMAIFKQMM